MRFAIADPPYPGMAHLYKDHPDYGGEVDHAELIARLIAEFPDGWALCSFPQYIAEFVPLCPTGTRVLAWCKPNARTPDRYPSVIRSWETVFCKPIRKPQNYERDFLVDFYPQVSGRRFPGEKPESFSFWLFRCLGALPGDDLVDLFPGSGAVGRAWDKFQRQMTLPMEREKGKQTRFGEEARETPELAAT